MHEVKRGEREPFHERRDCHRWDFCLCRLVMQHCPRRPCALPACQSSWRQLAAALSRHEARRPMGRDNRPSIEQRMRRIERYEAYREIWNVGTGCSLPCVFNTRIMLPDTRRHTNTGAHIYPRALARDTCASISAGALALGSGGGWVAGERGVFTRTRFWTSMWPVRESKSNEPGEVKTRARDRMRVHSDLGAYHHPSFCPVLQCAI